MGRVLAVIIWIITLLSVLLFVSGKWWFPEGISEHAPALDRQFMITIIVVGISFTAAQVGLGWMVWKYRDTGSATRPRRLFPRQQSTRGALDGHHRGHLYHARRDGPKRLGFVAFERGASGFLLGGSSGAAVSMELPLRRQRQQVRHAPIQSLSTTAR